MKKIHLLLLSLIMGVNSILYSTYGAKNNCEGLWDFSHYVLYAVYLVLLVAAFEKSNFQKKITFLLCAALPAAGVLWGFKTRNMEFAGDDFYVNLGIQCFFFAASLIVLTMYTKFITSNENASQKSGSSSHKSKHADSSAKMMSPEQVADFMKSENATEEHRRLFFASSCVFLAFFPLLSLIVAAALIRNATESFNTFKDVFILSELIFLALDLTKFHVYKKQKYILILLELIIQAAAIVSYFYLNTTVYYQSHTHNFAVGILPAVSVIPFLLSSSKITKAYTALMNRERNSSNEK